MCTRVKLRAWHVEDTREAGYWLYVPVVFLDVSWTRKIINYFSALLTLSSRSLSWKGLKSIIPSRHLHWHSNLNFLQFINVGISNTVRYADLDSHVLLQKNKIIHYLWDICSLDWQDHNYAFSYRSRSCLVAWIWVVSWYENIGNLLRPIRWRVENFFIIRLCVICSLGSSVFCISWVILLTI